MLVESCGRSESVENKERRRHVERDGERPGIEKTEDDWRWGVAEKSEDEDELDSRWRAIVENRELRCKGQI
jgi:hypothetical protein